MFPNKYLGRQGRERKNNDWFPDSSLNLNNTGHTSCRLIHKQHKYTRVNIYLVIYTESLFMLAFIVNHTKMAYYHYIVIALLHCPTNTYLRNEQTDQSWCVPGSRGVPRALPGTVPCNPPIWGQCPENIPPYCMTGLPLTSTPNFLYQSDHSVLAILNTIGLSSRQRARPYFSVRLCWPCVWWSQLHSTVCSQVLESTKSASPSY